MMDPDVGEIFSRANNSGETMKPSNQQQHPVGTNNGRHRMENPGAIKVLMYHRIVRDPELARRHSFCLHMDEFQRHLEWIDRWGFTPITFEDYRLFADDQLVLPRKPIIITFDDGYLDTYDVAFPILQEFGMHAVVFVLGDRSLTTNVWDSGTSMPPTQLLNNHHILEMAAAGIEIGAHSLTHVRLTELDSHAAWEEISRSRILLEILLNLPVRTFSYPYGLVNPSVKKMVETAGFQHACSVWSGPPTFGKDNYELRRISILNSTTTSGLALKIVTPFQYYNWMQWKMRTVLHGSNGVHDHPQESRVHQINSTDEEE